MSVLIVGNILKDVYLNLDSRSEKYETDQNGVRWLDVSFDASEHHFFSRNSSLGGAAISLEVLQKLGIRAEISDSKLDFNNDKTEVEPGASVHRYILTLDGNVCYLAPSEFRATDFTSPSEAVDYLYIDRSAELTKKVVNQINAYLDLSAKTKLVLYVRNSKNRELNSLLPRADLVFLEKNGNNLENYYAPELDNVDPVKVITLTEDELKYQDISEKISVERVDMSTHLSVYSIAAATILGNFILGSSVEESMRLAKINVENSRLDAVLSINELKELSNNVLPEDNLALVAANLVLKGKGILAADESGGSIKKKFEQLNISDTAENRRDYRNIFLSTPDLEKYVNGVILFDETARQSADDGQDFVNYLISRRIIPGIKVDQGLENFPESEETFTKGLDGLEKRLAEYCNMGLRFAKWRAAFKISPSEKAIDENCRILAEYAKKCQLAGLVPIVEPEVVYDDNFSIEQCAETTGKILDNLFDKLKVANVALDACILKVNMVLAGKQSENQSSPDEVGSFTANVLKEHVPEKLAGVVFLSGGQSVEQATNNLAAIIKNGPFPWPVTFSFARALQDPALYAWAGDNQNIEKAKSAFLERLILNCEALEN